MAAQLRFTPGRNIAVKVPPHHFDATVRFYRDTLGLELLTTNPPAIGFKFGPMNLWLDRVPALSQAEVWLEVLTSDIDAAAAALARDGIERCDEIEPLPEGMRAFWIASPASIVHLVCAESESW